MIFDVQNPPDLRGRQLFFDTCVWLAINGPDYRRPKRSFSSLFKVALQQRVPIHINDYVVSEFHNRYLKMDYAVQFPNDNHSKDFKSRRERGDLYSILEGLRDTCRNMVDDCVPGLSFTDFEGVNACLETCCRKNLDYTDAVIEQHCLKLGLTLVTSDHDFDANSLDIITDNKRALREAGL